MSVKSNQEDEEFSLEDDEAYTPVVEATVAGAPAEKLGVLGHEVTLLSAIMLNVGQLIGSGIFAVSGILLSSVGSVGLLLIYWVITPIFAFAGLSLYSELASMFPHRSGAEVVYLEQAYPRPRFFVPTSFAVITVLTSFSSANAIVFAQYSMSAFNVAITGTSQTVVALAAVIMCCTCVALSTKWSLRIVNFFTVFKILALFFVVATGLAVLAGFTRIKDPYANFKDPFAGSTSSANSLVTAFVKTNYTFIGWHNAFNVLGEIKGNDPVRTARKAGQISLSLISALFLFINIAYVAAVPREDIQNSGQLIALLFFRNVFGETGAKVFPLMVALSCLGNIIAVTIGQARVLREVARQGLLPYPAFFSSIRPFGTPIGPIGLKGFLTAFLLLAVPAKDAFNFILDLAAYPGLIFQSAMCVGVWIIRRRRRRAAVPASSLQAWNMTIILYLASCVILLVVPWVPPEPGHADVSFWYATYCVAGIGLLLCCALYYWLWIIVLPRYGGYEIVEEIEESGDNTRNTKLVRRYHSFPSRSEEESALLHEPSAEP